MRFENIFNLNNLSVKLKYEGKFLHQLTIMIFEQNDTKKTF
jgi:hypothetical protein